MKRTPPNGPLDDLLRLGGRVTDILSDEILATDGHKVVRREVPESMENLRHLGSHGRLSRAGRAGEAHVEVGPGRVEPEARSQAVDEQRAPISLRRRLTASSPTSCWSSSSRARLIPSSVPREARSTVAPSGREPASSPASPRSGLSDGGHPVTVGAYAGGVEAA
jgi:hypothetical protein